MFPRRAGRYGHNFGGHSLYDDGYMSGSSTDSDNLYSYYGRRTPSPMMHPRYPPTFGHPPPPSIVGSAMGIGLPRSRMGPPYGLAAPPPPPARPLGHGPELLSAGPPSRALPELGTGLPPRLARVFDINFDDGDDPRYDPRFNPRFAGRTNVITLHNDNGADTHSITLTEDEPTMLAHARRMATEKFARGRQQNGAVVLSAAVRTGAIEHVSDGPSGPIVVTAPNREDLWFALGLVQGQEAWALLGAGAHGTRSQGKLYLIGLPGGRLPAAADGLGAGRGDGGDRLFGGRPDPLLGGGGSGGDSMMSPAAGRGPMSGPGGPWRF